MRTVRNAPNPRLTGLGSGLFCAVVMFLIACLDLELLGGSPTVYGVLFLPVSTLTALWVRRADLVAAPVAVPIGFALGALPISGGADDGFGSRVMGLFTTLAMYAVWLYGGTLIAGVIATVRKIRLMRRRAAALRERTARGRSGPGRGAGNGGGPGGGGRGGGAPAERAARGRLRPPRPGQAPPGPRRRSA
ncbi:DUF6542 domain-containing protein [Streptomyces sulfonofaciens]|uniref:DUF6542 domain-containing protein n=1 Tax=Streptomyces sulfonofaciens TaxID=68272 RepID=UPI0027E4F1FF|nr:DUF6542 domain-containing protein [Streptomyces sulfonofaciens]